MDIEKAKDKIRKCLALAGSPEPAEASAALRQAQKLMSLYNIDEASLDEREQGTRDVFAQAKKVRQPWEGVLAAAIAKVFGVGVHWTRDKLIPAGGGLRQPAPDSRRVLRYYGDAARVELAAHAHAALVRAAVRARTAYVKAHKIEHGWVSPSVGRSFVTGYASSVAQAAVPLVPSPTEQRQLDEYRERTGLARVGRRRIGYDPDHYGNGKAAGAAHGGLNVPVRGSAPVLQIGG